MLRLTARLAYLSACDTQFAPPDLADESVHITGACHLAGYQHVIGTLWSIDDTVAQRVAVGVYRRLTQDGTTAPDAALAAQALHHATRDLRRSYPGEPALWITHTHARP